MKKMNVMDTDISVVNVKDEDYLCLTDMIRAKDGDFFVTDWLRNRNTLEYLGIWEKLTGFSAKRYYRMVTRSSSTFLSL